MATVTRQLQLTDEEINLITYALRHFAGESIFKNLKEEAIELLKNIEEQSKMKPTKQKPGS